MQVGSLGSLHTQVPPVSDRMDALTAMMYALEELEVAPGRWETYMVKKVVTPALNSVQKRVLLISFS
jgi:hypothetical protein